MDSKYHFIDCSRVRDKTAWKLPIKFGPSCQTSSLGRRSSTTAGCMESHSSKGIWCGCTAPSSPGASLGTSTALGRGRIRSSADPQRQCTGCNTRDSDVSDWWYIHFDRLKLCPPGTRVPLTSPIQQRQADAPSPQRPLVGTELVDDDVLPSQPQPDHGHVTSPPPEVGMAPESSSPLVTTRDPPSPPLVAPPSRYPRRNRTQPDRYCPGASHRT